MPIWMPAVFRMLGVLAAAVLLAAPPTQAKGAKKVVVASETWAHVLYEDARGKPAGAVADFVQRMNAVQNKFHFELSIYPRLRLDALFAAGAADVYPLRTPAWVDPALGLLPSRTIVESGDLYIARKTNHYGGDKVFDSLATKIIAGVRGYHYELFGNNSDEAYIKRNFRAELLGTNEAVVQFVLADRADIGIVPEAILAKYLQDPATRGQILVGGFDSRVELSNLVRKGGAISVAEMNAVIALMVKSGDVDKLRAQFTLPGRSR